MKPITVPIRPSSTRLLAMCLTGAIRAASLSRSVEASSARLWPSRGGDRAQIGRRRRRAVVLEALDLVQRLADLDRAAAGQSRPAANTSAIAIE